MSDIEAIESNKRSPSYENSEVASDQGITYYMDASGGSDSNDGTSIASAWSSISKLNDEMNGGVINPGDDIYFKRGEKWVYMGERLRLGEGGTSTNPMILGAYGTGPKPVFTEENYQAFFCDRPLGHIIIQDLELNNTVKYNIFFYNGCNAHNITIRNCNILGSSVFFFNTRDIKIENCLFDIDNERAHGIGFSQYSPGIDIENVIIRNCTIRDCKDGISLHFGDISENNNLGDNFWIENCTISNTFEEPIDVVGGIGCDNIFIRGVEMYDCPNLHIGHGQRNVTVDGAYLHDSTTNTISLTTARHVRIRNSIIMDWEFNGIGKSANQYPPDLAEDISVYNNNIISDGQEDHIQINNENVDGIYFINNIFLSTAYSSPNSFINYIPPADLENTGSEFRNNIWWRGDGVSEVNRWWGDMTISQWNAQPQVKNDRIADPGLSDVLDQNFTLSEQSPCIDQGTWLTKTEGSGVMSNSIKVEEANHFFDGFDNIGPDMESLSGDIIFIGDDQNLEVVNVNYITDIIEVNRSISWSTGDQIGLAEFSSNMPSTYDYVKCQKIYGKPDIGAYEYQPSRSILEDPVSVGSKIEIYNDGNFRYSIPGSNEYADLMIIPLKGWQTYNKGKVIDLAGSVEILKWETTGDHHKRWNENWLTQYKNLYSIGQLLPNTEYDLMENGLTLKRQGSDVYGLAAYVVEISTKNRTFDIIQNRYPVLLHESGQKNFNTGDLVDLHTLVIDDKGIELVTIEYWVDNDITHYKVDLDLINGTYKEGFWGTSIEIPINRIGIFNYNLSTRDIEGLWNRSEIFTIEIIDNIAPELLFDTTPTTASTGSTLKFKFDIIDNIGIEYAKLEYSSDGGSVTTEILDIDDHYYKDIVISDDHYDEIRYIVEIMDLSGNSYRSEIKSISIIDDDPPILVNDHTSKVFISGDIITIKAEVMDNIGVKQVVVNYWFDESYVIEAKMKHNYRNYTLEITLPDDHDNRIMYQFLIEDVSGNTILTQVMTSDIRIDDLDELDHIDIFEPLENQQLSGNFFIKASVLTQTPIHHYFLMVDSSQYKWIPSSSISIISGSRLSISYLLDSNELENGQYSINIAGFDQLSNILLISDTVNITIGNLENSSILSRIELAPQNAIINMMQNVNFQVYAYDQFDQRISNDFLNIEWFLNNTNGRIFDNGLFIPKRSGFCKILIRVESGPIVLFQNSSVFVQTITNGIDNDNVSKSKDQDGENFTLWIITVLLALASFSILGLIVRTRSQDIIRYRLRKRVLSERSSFAVDRIHDFKGDRYSPYDYTLHHSMIEHGKNQKTRKLRSLKQKRQSSHSIHYSPSQDHSYGQHGYSPYSHYQHGK